MRQLNYSIFVSLIAFVFISNKATAQLTVSQQTANFLVQNVLIGQGVQVSNISFTGDSAQIGQFLGGNATNLGITGGVVMSTGIVTDNVQGPNDAGGYTASPFLNVSDDPDLNTIISSLGAEGVTNNICIIEFDFIPSGDSLRFKYVFGSEEYDEWVCSDYFDAFGFFLSGPGIAGPYSNGSINLAQVPGTSFPVGINTVNNGSVGGSVFNPICPNGGLNNSSYYLYNGLQSLQMDGFTTLLTAEAELQCGSTYHIKLVIANGGDTSFDSWVFLQAESFSSSIPNFTATNLLPDSSVIEGCSTGNLIFTRDNADEEFIIPIVYTGSAVFDVDFTGLPDSIIFPIGVDSLFFTLTPVNDGITEGTELIIITYNVPNECGDTITVSDVIKIKDPYELVITTPDPTLNCPNPNYTIGAQVSGGYEPYSYSWDYNNLITPTINVPISHTDTFIVQIHDLLNCVLNQYTDTVVVTLNYDSLQTATIAQKICLGDSILLSPLVQAGLEPYTYEWVNLATTDTVTVNPSDTTGYVYIITDACNISSQDTFFVNVPEYEPLTVTVNDTTICKRGTVDLISFATGGDGDYTYYWSGPPVINKSTDSTSYASPETTTKYWIDVYDGCNTVATDTLYVTVESCELEVGNAFSPNSDGKNDYFEIANIIYYPESTVFLYNRWGKKVLEQKAYQNNWGGDDEVTAGTYFYVVDPGDGTSILKGTVTIFKD
ncbi:MAG TPA: choice-of-anchor L domain-containing protein [Flavobacteriales bacterium]|nr:choice-of-anchor L domain-containing protein [Flavobacteriales bacterium]